MIQIESTKINVSMFQYIIKIKTYVVHNSQFHSLSDVRDKK